MICYGCMGQKQDGEATCPICGYVSPEHIEHYYLKEGTILHDRYLIGKILGHGGFGITYLGLDQVLGIQVAIKEYLPSDIATRSENSSTVLSFSGEKKDQYEYGLARFLEEAKSLAKYNHHPCIVSTTDFFTDNNTAYLVMEYLDGIPLNEYLKRKGGRISVEDTIKIMMPMLDALREVHGEGMIHRDISPDNIYITKTGQVKLLDFGAARFALGEKSKSLSVILKPGYAPPEQYTSRGKQGTWTDIYAVGATLYRCITGRSVPEAMDRVMNDDIIRPSRLGIEIDGAKEAAMMKALSVRSEDRYQEIVPFQEALLAEEKKPASVEEPKQEALSPAVEHKTNPTSGVSTKRIVIFGIVSVIVLAIILTTAIKNSQRKQEEALVQSLWEQTGITGSLYDEIKYQYSNPTIRPSDITTLTLRNLHSVEPDLYLPSLEPLNQLPNLTNLKIMHYIITDECELETLTRLTSLSFHNCLMNKIDFVTALSNLDNFELTFIDNLENIEPLAGMHLSRISLEGSLIDDFLPILEIVGLEEIQLDNNMPVDWSILAQLLIAQGVELKDVDNFGQDTYMDAVLVKDFNASQSLFDPNMANITLDYQLKLKVDDNTRDTFSHAIPMPSGDFAYPLSSEDGQYLVIVDSEGVVKERIEMNISALDGYDYWIESFTDDDCFIVTAYDEDVHFWDANEMIMMELTTDGDVLWLYEFDGHLIDYEQTSDSGYIIVGYTGDYQVQSIHIAKIDSRGIESWAYTYGGSDSENVNTVIEMDSGGYLVFGETSSNDGDISSRIGGERNLWLIQIDENGQLVRDLCFGNNSYNFANSLIKVDDGYVFCATITGPGGMVSESYGEFDAWIVRLDENLNLIWERTIGDAIDQHATLWVSDQGYYYIPIISLEEIPVPGDEGAITWEYRYFALHVMNDDGDVIFEQRLDEMGDLDIDALQMISNTEFILYKSYYLAREADYDWDHYYEDTHYPYVEKYSMQ